MDILIRRPLEDVVSEKRRFLLGFLSEIENKILCRCRWLDKQPRNAGEGVARRGQGGV